MLNTGLIALVQTCMYLELELLIKILLGLLKIIYDHFQYIFDYQIFKNIYLRESE